MNRKCITAWITCEVRVERWRRALRVRARTSRRRRRSTRDNEVSFVTNATQRVRHKSIPKMTSTSSTVLQWVVDIERGGWGEDEERWGEEGKALPRTSARGRCFCLENPKRARENACTNHSNQVVSEVSGSAAAGSYARRATCSNQGNPVSESICFVIGCEFIIIYRKHSSYRSSSVLMRTFRLLRH